MDQESKCQSNLRIHLGVAVVVLTYISIFVSSYWLHSGIQNSQDTSLTTAVESHTVVAESLQACNKSIHVVIQFIQGGASNRHKLQRNLYHFLSSLLSHTQCHVAFHIVTDVKSKPSAVVVVDNIRLTHDNFNVVFINASVVREEIPLQGRGVYEVMMGGDETRYYNRWFFYTSLVLHRILPHNLTQVLMMDIDMQVREDILYLHNHFHDMGDHQIVGLAREQQPVYAHVTWVYRETHKHTLVGAPPPTGLTGFNSGVLLMDLHKMRESAVYNGYLDDPGKLRNLTTEFKFRGHLGDQDMYTLLSFRHAELFHVLPCQWNRQLCQWWRNKGFEKIFHLYHECPPPHFVLHGNCDTPIPAM